MFLFSIKLLTLVGEEELLGFIWIEINTRTISSNANSKRFLTQFLIAACPQTVGLLICTLISENQGLEKSRSVLNLRKVSGPSNLDFF